MEQEQRILEVLDEGRNDVEELTTCCPSSTARK